MLTLDGTIAPESWFDDEVSPKMFSDDLYAGDGDITVWINSPGGDCIAAAQIYNMLKAYAGNVTVKVDGIAASAASVIAMAGDKVLMSPVSLMMIHNPSTLAFGDHNDMQKAIDMLNEVKESIINAYTIKTGLSRAKLSHLMEDETWMNSEKAMELGFCDGVLTREGATTDDAGEKPKAMMYSPKAVNNVLLNKIEKHYGKPAHTVAKQAEIIETGRSVDEINGRLLLMKNFI